MFHDNFDMKNKKYFKIRNYFEKLLHFNLKQPLQDKLCSQVTKMEAICETSSNLGA